jgi:hypothetical protein
VIEPLLTKADEHCLVIKIVEEVAILIYHGYTRIMKDVVLRISYLKSSLTIDTSCVRSYAMKQVLTDCI